MPPQDAFKIAFTGQTNPTCPRLNAPFAVPFPRMPAPTASSSDDAPPAPRTDVVNASKEELRRRFRAHRRSLSRDAHRRASAAIVARTRSLPDVEAARSVLAYWPLTDRGEVDVRPLVASLLDRGVSISLPVVTGFERGAPDMEARRYTGPEALTANRWGIPEPIDGDRVDPTTLDLVIVPALGAGRNGHRIGHGAGYYDAFLNGLDVVTVGVVYAACLVDCVPADAHDVPLDVIVTDDATLRPE